MSKEAYDWQKVLDAVIMTIQNLVLTAMFIVYMNKF
jgi:hypothetical protein